MESGFEDHIACMNLLSQLHAVYSKTGLSIVHSKNKFKDGLNKNLIQEKNISAFLDSQLFFGLLINKTILEENRYKRQQSMLNQIDRILTIIDNELKNN